MQSLPCVPPTPRAAGRLPSECLQKEPKVRVCRREPVLRRLMERTHHSVSLPERRLCSLVFIRVGQVLSETLCSVCSLCQGHDNVLGTPVPRRASRSYDRDTGRAHGLCPWGLQHLQHAGLAGRRALLSAVGTCRLRGAPALPRSS